MNTPARPARGAFGVECLWAETGKRVWIDCRWTRAWARHLVKEWRDAYNVPGVRVRVRLARRRARRPA